MGDQGFGETFEIRFFLATDKGQATVLSGWIHDFGVSSRVAGDGFNFSASLKF